MIEEWCYEQMALMSSAFAFSWSKWNSDIPEKEKILFQGSEALQDEPLLEVCSLVLSYCIKKIE